MAETDRDFTVLAGQDPSVAVSQELRSLLAEADRLAQAARRGSTRSGLAPETAQQLQFVANRLVRSVTRPLSVALSSLGGEQRQSDASAPEDAGDLQLAEQLWLLARAATGLRARGGLPPELQEATAALQDLALLLAEDVAPARLEELRGMVAGLPRQVQLVRNGPYVTTNVEHLDDWLGVPMRALPQMALCRCGASALKPFCDGAHAETGFTDTKDAGRVPDRQDSYDGLQVTVLDNRGTCQHSGFCTDRLNSVFHLGSEPFATPSGGRMDDIIRVVRDCPSGALSFALDGREEREAVDFNGSREPAIEVSKDGPYRVIGGVHLCEADGGDIERNQGASLEHYALCRCGKSQNKPFCSGMHWYVEFKDPVPDPDREPTVFEWAGGLPALHRMTRVFYERYVPADPLLSRLFSTMLPNHPERVAKWLSEVFGGPSYYTDEYGGYGRMLRQHMGKSITEEQRGRWVQLLYRSALDAGLPNDPEFRAAFNSYIEWGSRLAVENSVPGCKPPLHMPVPHWDWGTAAGPPGSRIPATPPGAEEKPAPPIVLPEPNEQVLFGKHVQPLFRRQDRRSMQFAFDLWKYEDVKQHAEGILKRLEDGSMPCDGRWPAERVDVFRRWVESGMTE